MLSQFGQSGVSLKSILVSLGLFLLLAALPIGVFLVQTQTNLFPQASAPVQIPPETSFSLEINKDLPVAQGEVPVNILARSDISEANLFVAQLTFSPTLLEVKRVVTDSSFTADVEGNQLIKRWIDSSFDNQKGTISLVGGIPDTGIKTVPGTKYLMAVVIFKVKGDTNINVKFDSTSAIYKNDGNSNILASKKDLSESVSNLPASLKIKSCQTKNDCDQATSCQSSDTRQNFCQISNTAALVVGTKTATDSANLLTLVNPKGGEVFSYFNPITIEWTGGIASSSARPTGSPQKADNATILLYRNNTLVGSVGTVGINSGRYNWSPATTLPLVFVGKNNIFQVAISSPNNSQMSAPFGLTAEKGAKTVGSAEVATGVGLDLTGDGIVDYIDLSAILTAYNKPLTDTKYDLNKDNLLNDVDLWLIGDFLKRKN